MAHLRNDGQGARAPEVTGTTRARADRYVAEPPDEPSQFICRVLSVLTLGVMRFVIVSQSTARELTAFGRLKRICDPGLQKYWSFWGFYQRTGRIVPTSEITRAWQDEEVLTRDGVKACIDVMICYRVTDVGKALYNVDNYQGAIYSLVQAVLRNACGMLRAQDMLAGRAQLVGGMRSSLEEDVLPWGLQIRLVEITNIEMIHG